MTELTPIVCQDGVAIKGRWMRSEGVPSTTVIVAPGAAAEARFYLPFCEYLASTGVDVLTFDFRTIGESRIDATRRRVSGFTDWIEQDYPAVVAHARTHGRGGFLVVIGHSAGGWMGGVQPAADKIDAFVGVAALSGHWRHMARPHRYAHWLAWHLVVPLACRLLRFWPGVIGFRRNLAPRFGLQFSRWARHPEFVFSEPDFEGNAAKFRGRMHLFQIADDPWGTAVAVSSFRDWFPNASGRVVETIPVEAAPSASIGHFGVFRKANASSLWPRIAHVVHGCWRDNPVARVA